MKMVFATERLKKQCNNQELLVHLYGSERARLVRQRLDELFNAEVLEDIRAMPHIAIAGASPESELAMGLDARYSLVFKPTHGQDPGGEWKNIDSITILGIRKHHA